jgi:hypothetical protein
LPDLSVSSQDVSFVPSVVYRGVSTLIRAVIRNMGETPVSSFIVRFLAEGVFLTDRSVSVDGESNVSVDASWMPIGNSTSNVSVLIDPLNSITESSKDNNQVDKSVFVLPDRPYPPLPGDQTTTTLNGSCVMPGNGLPRNEVTLAEVVAGITSWSQGNIELNEVIGLINSSTDPVIYLPL